MTLAAHFFICNKRFATFTSFYTFACERSYINPIGRLERRPIQAYVGVKWLTPKEGKIKLAAIDRSTLAGKRDLALLSVGIRTSRHLSELAGLRWSDVHQGDGDKLTLN